MRKRKDESDDGLVTLTDEEIDSSWLDHLAEDYSRRFRCHRVDHSF